MLSTVKRKFRTALSIIRSPDRVVLLQQGLRHSYCELSMRLGGGSRLVYRTKHGFAFVCIKGNAISEGVYFRGTWDPLEIELASRWLQSGDRCIDAGANIGYYSAALSNYVGHSGLVVAIEPSDIMHSSLQELKKTLALTQLLVLQACVGDSMKKVVFHAGVEGNSLLTQGMVISEDNDHTYVRTEANCITLDHVINEYCDGSVALVKVDVEGAEAMVLAGLSPALRSVPLWIIEVNRSALKRNGVSQLDVLNAFSDESFHRYIIRLDDDWAARDHVVAYDGQLEATKLPRNFNLVAIPKMGPFANRFECLVEWLGEKTA